MPNCLLSYLNMSVHGSGTLLKFGYVVQRIHGWNVWRLQNFWWQGQNILHMCQWLVVGYTSHAWTSISHSGSWPHCWLESVQSYALSKIIMTESEASWILLVFGAPLILLYAWVASWYNLNWAEKLFAFLCVAFSFWSFSFHRNKFTNSPVELVREPVYIRPLWLLLRVIFYSKIVATTVVVRGLVRDCHEVYTAHMPLSVLFSLLFCLLSRFHL